MSENIISIKAKEKRIQEEMARRCAEDEADKQQALDILLDLHKRHLSGDEGGAMFLADHISFKGLNFRGADLTRAVFNTCDLSETNMRGVTLNKADIKSCSVQRADLSGASLFDAKITMSNFSDSDLTCSKIYASLFFNVDLTSCQLDEVDLAHSFFLHPVGSNSRMAMFSFCGIDMLVIDSRIVWCKENTLWLDEALATNCEELLGGACTPDSTMRRMFMSFLSIIKQEKDSLDSAAET